MSESESRCIVLTGASRGLGRAMASEFIERGHTVIGCSRSESAVNQLRRQWGAPHRWDVVDVAAAAAVKRWSQEVLSHCGPPDLLINNAGIINQNARLWEVDPEEFSQVIDVNLKGVYHVLRFFLPAMIEQERGVIVNFSSGWGRSTSPDVAPYCAAKWGVEGLTRALADELPPGMAAIPLNPGVVHTEMLESCFGTSASAYPLPETWARTTVPFLLDLEAADSGDPLTAPTG